MINWNDVAKKSANAIFHSAHSRESVEKVRKDISRACKELTEGEVKDEVWGGFFQTLSKEYSQLMEKTEEILIVEVVVALPLDDEDRVKIKNALKTYTKRDIELEETVDPNIIGGIVIKLSDRVFDDSVVRRLEMIKAKIAEGLGT